MKKCYYNTLKHFKTLSQFGVFSLLFLYFFLSGGIAKASIYVDANKTLTYGNPDGWEVNGNVATIDLTINESCGNSLMILISNTWIGNTPNTADFNGDNFTQGFRTAIENGGQRGLAAYYLLNPDSGTHTLTLNNFDGVRPAQVVVFCNVDQLDPFYQDFSFSIGSNSNSISTTTPTFSNIGEKAFIVMPTKWDSDWEAFSVSGFSTTTDIQLTTRGNFEVENFAIYYKNITETTTATATWDSYHYSGIGSVILNNDDWTSTPTCAENYVLVDGICYYSPQQEQACADGYTEVDGICLYNGILPDCADGYTEVYNADWGGLICLKTELLPTGADNCDPITETPVYGLNGWECFLNAETTKQPKDPKKNSFGWNTYEMACSPEKWNTPDPVIGIDWLNATTSLPALNFDYLFCSFKKFSLDMASYPLEYIRVQATKLKGRAQTIFPFNILNGFLKSFQKAEMRVGLFEIKTAHATSTFDFMEMPENGEGFNVKLGKIGDNDEMTFKLFNKTDIENTLGSDLVGFMRNFFNLALYFLFFIYIFQRIKNFDL